MADVTDSTSNYSTEQVIWQATFPAGVDIRKGQVITPDATTGKWRLCLATTAPLAGKTQYYAVKTVKAGHALTGNLMGLASYGPAFDAMAFGDIVYLSDTPGELSSTAGTVSVALGVIDPDWREVTPKRIYRFWPNDL